MITLLFFFKDDLYMPLNKETKPHNNTSPSYLTRAISKFYIKKNLSILSPVIQ